MADEMARKMAKLADRVAAIVGKTYAVKGDGFELADNRALALIRDLLDEIDPKIIDRNQHKRLSRQ